MNTQFSLKQLHTDGDKIMTEAGSIQEVSNSAHAAAESTFQAHDSSRNGNDRMKRTQEPMSAWPMKFSTPPIPLLNWSGKAIPLVRSWK